jgi:hypothetical protein
VPEPDATARPEAAAAATLAGPRHGVPGWVWALLASVLLCLLLACAAATLFVAWGWNLFAGQARAALQADPVVQARIGRIVDMRLAVLATGIAPGVDTFVFDLRGERGSGRAEVDFHADGADRETLGEGVLTLAGGERLHIGMQDDATDDPAPGDCANADDGTDAQDDDDDADGDDAACPADTAPDDGDEAVAPGLRA